MSEVGDSVSFCGNRLCCHRQMPGSAERQAGRNMGSHGREGVKHDPLAQLCRPATHPPPASAFSKRDTLIFRANTSKYRGLITTECFCLQSHRIIKSKFDFSKSFLCLLKGQYFLIFLFLFFFFFLILGYCTWLSDGWFLVCLA